MLVHDEHDELLQIGVMIDDILVFEIYVHYDDEVDHEMVCEVEIHDEVDDEVDGIELADDDEHNDNEIIDEILIDVLYAMHDEGEVEHDEYEVMHEDLIDEIDE